MRLEPFTPGADQYEVYLDSKRVDYCFWADDETGEVECIVTDEAGLPVVDPGPQHAWSYMRLKGGTPFRAKGIVREAILRGRVELRQVVTL